MPNRLLKFRQLGLSWKGLLGFVLILVARSIQAQPVTLWDKTLGGESSDVLRSVVASSDGGYLVGGYSASLISGDKTEGSKGNTGYTDYWIVKINAKGDKQWDRVLGGSSADELSVMLPTADGGYLLGGSTISPVSGDKTGTSKGGWDFWIVKIDANGNKQWDKTLGGSSNDLLRSMVKTSDGGFLLGGYSSYLADDRSKGTKGMDDYWIIKIDANANEQWNKSIGHTGDDRLTSIKTMADGGFLLGGISTSPTGGDKTESNLGDFDYWIVKIDAQGNKLWDKTLGGSKLDYLRTLLVTPDGGFLLGGDSDSNTSSTKTQNSKGSSDMWVVKLSANGVKQWDRTLGGAYTEQLSTMITTTDGGYMLGGHSDSGSGGDKTESQKGGYDYWIVKLDANGQKLWDQTIGSSSTDNFISLLVSSDGGILMGGNSSGNAGYDKTQDSKGANDYWLIKVKECAPPVVSVDASSHLLTCTAPSVTLTVNTGGNSGALTYTWNTGAVSSSINVTQAGRYSVKVTNEAGCPSSAEVEITSVVETFSADLSSSGVIDCARPTVQLQATPGFYTGWKYAFSSGATQLDGESGNRATVKQPGVYTVLITNPNGCTATASIVVEGSATLPAAPALSASSLSTNNQPIAITATGCSGQLNWSVQGGTGIAYGSVYTLSAPGQYTVSATCTVNNCSSPAASLVLTIQAGVSPLKLVPPTYNCQTGAITFNTQGGNGSLIEYSAAGITRWSAGRNHTVESGLRRDPKVILLQARQNGVVVGFNFNLPAACSGPAPANTSPLPPSQPILTTSLVAQVGVPFSGTLAAFTDKESPASLSYSLTGLPGGLNFAQSGRTISGTPTQAGSFVVTYQATDEQGATGSINFTFTVNPEPTAPVTGNFEGFLDKVECGTIRGWVWDRSKPNAPVTVEFYTGNVVWGSVVANIYRSDLKTAGKGNGSHAYSFEVPTALKDGTQRLIYARVSGSAYDLKWSGKPLLCPAASRLAAEQSQDMEVILLGNPVANHQIEIDVRGAQGQPLQFFLTDVMGRTLSQRTIEEAATVERQAFPVVNQGGGNPLFMRVQSRSQSVTLKILQR